jgi:chromosome segregation ATPase
MTEPAVAPHTPDVAEIVSFLRRFADLMSNGYNASYLHSASNLLERLAVRAITASDEEDLWRYKYETLTRQAEALAAECDALKSDIQGHLDITSSVVAERELLATTLQAREAELSESRDALGRERDQRAEKSAAHEEALAGLRAAFDAKHIALRAALQARSEECDLFRRDLERQRDEGAATSASSEAELSRHRSTFDREQSELQNQLRARDDELALFRLASERERDALNEKVAFLEAGRARLRIAFDQINYLGNQAIEARDRAENGFSLNLGTALTFNALPVQAEAQLAAAAEGSAVVPKHTLRQARAQFEYLARQFIPLGDVASQVMCELGAYTMDVALSDSQHTDHLPVGEVARSILAPDGANRS